MTSILSLSTVQDEMSKCILPFFTNWRRCLKWRSCRFFVSDLISTPKPLDKVLQLGSKWNPLYLRLKRDNYWQGNAINKLQKLLWNWIKESLRGLVNKFPDWIFRARTEYQPLEVLFPSYHGLACWKPAFCGHRVWHSSSFYQEVQRSLCDYRDGGFQWRTRLHQILFQVGENCYRMLWNVEDSFWGTRYGSFPNISVVFPV